MRTGRPLSADPSQPIAPRARLQSKKARNSPRPSTTAASTLAAKPANAAWREDVDRVAAASARPAMPRRALRAGAGARPWGSLPA
jgi:hypothetical protein